MAHGGCASIIHLEIPCATFYQGHEQNVPPVTAPGRVFTIFYVIIGIGIVAALIGQIASLTIREARDTAAGEG